MWFLKYDYGFIIILYVFKITFFYFWTKTVRRKYIKEYMFGKVEDKKMEPN